LRAPRSITLVNLATQQWRDDGLEPSTTSAVRFDACGGAQTSRIANATAVAQSLSACPTACPVSASSGALSGAIGRTGAGTERRATGPVAAVGCDELEEGEQKDSEDNRLHRLERDISWFPEIIDEGRTLGSENGF